MSLKLECRKSYCSNYRQRLFLLALLEKLCDTANRFYLSNHQTLSDELYPIESNNLSKYWQEYWNLQDKYQLVYAQQNKIKRKYVKKTDEEKNRIKRKYTKRK